MKLQHFKQSDILVAVSTRPDYIPIMNKASAFVTNTGGILSHAAITSREMKKQCVIGTTVATKIFKDGDKVEVDADKGVVRKVK
jgi:pyruvate, water dikinase